MSGRYFLKSSFACFTSAVRSARNRMLVTHLPRLSTSVRLEAVRVLPVPVAITSRCLRMPFWVCSQTARMAAFW